MSSCGCPSLGARESSGVSLIGAVPPSVRTREKVLASRPLYMPWGDQAFWSTR